jgi:adenylate cyclase
MTGERVVRRLAAILAADVVGYSRLMGRDENGTLARLKAHRNERFEPTLARHGGRLVKLTGDGALVEFASVVDALGAAIEFQQAMAAANKDQPEDTAIVFRIGLHLGDLIVEGYDLYGDGVNVAARLEAEAPPGGILISGDVYNAVAGRLKAAFDDLGSLVLKNIERPLQAYEVKWEAAEWKAPAAAQPIAISPPARDVPLALPDKPSIAVLPFQNMSGDPEQEYFADGVVEDIITALSRFKSLFVIARNSSFSYKGKSPDIRQVGRELGVRYVLEGSVRKAASRLRITGQLIDATTGAHLWADRFEGAVEDVFELQDQVTEKVVAALAPRIEQAEIDRAKRKTIGNLGAYDCYLRSLACLQTLSKQNVEEAMALSTQAIDLDPELAPAYGLLLFCHAAGKGFAAVRNPDKDNAEVARLVRIAVRIVHDDAVALSNTAWAVAYVLHDLSHAQSLVDRAVTLNPNLARAWGFSGWINLWSGNPALAVEHLTRAMRHDPLHSSHLMNIWSAMAHACFFLNRYNESMAWAERNLRESPDAHPSLRIIAAGAAFAGMTETARKIGARLHAVDPEFRVSRLGTYLGPYQKPEFLEKYAEGLRLAGLPE